MKNWKVSIEPCPDQFCPQTGVKLQPDNDTWIRDANGRAVALMSGQHTTPEATLMARAHRIAAAPEMYEVLQQMLTLGFHEDFSGAVIAVLRKADGK
jgi:hypothetical protein